MFGIDECFLVLDHVRMVNRCQYSDLVDRVLTIFSRHLADSDLFHRVELLVCDALYFIDLAVGPVSEFLHDHEVVNRRQFFLLLSFFRLLR